MGFHLQFHTFAIKFEDPNLFECTHPPWPRGGHGSNIVIAEVNGVTMFYCPSPLSMARRRTDFCCVILVTSDTASYQMAEERDKRRSRVYQAVAVGAIQGAAATASQGAVQGAGVVAVGVAGAGLGEGALAVAAILAGVIALFVVVYERVGGVAYGEVEGPPWLRIIAWGIAGGILGGTNAALQEWFQGTLEYDVVIVNT